MAKYRTKPGYKEYHNRKIKEYFAKNPEKYRATYMARNEALKPGSTLKKQACEHCGSTLKLHMHHPDYSKPLEVITLCIPCHESVHHG